MGELSRTRLMIWADSGIFCASSATSKLHSHHAIQVTYALDDRCRIRAASDSKWRRTPGFVVLPGCRYQAEVPGRFLTFFVDVNHPLYWRHKHADRSMYPNGLRCFDFATEMQREMLEFDRRELVCAKERDLLNDQIQLHFPEGGESPMLDSRIETIVRLIDQNAPLATKLEGICAAVELSESRTMHLFRSETGTTIRQYVLWRRLKLALLAISKGRNVTEAAYLANFSDSAHLTRTFVKMFGFSPTKILAGPIQAEFFVCPH